METNGCHGDKVQNGIHHHNHNGGGRGGGTLLMTTGLSEFENYGLTNDTEYDDESAQSMFLEIRRQNEDLMTSSSSPVLSLRRDLLSQKYWEFCTASPIHQTYHHRLSNFVTAASNLNRRLYTSMGFSFPEQDEVTKMCAHFFPFVVSAQRLYIIAAAIRLQIYLNDILSASDHHHHHPVDQNNDGYENFEEKKEQQQQDLIHCAQEKKKLFKKLILETDNYIKSRPDLTGQTFKCIMMRPLNEPRCSNYVYYATKTIYGQIRMASTPHWFTKFQNLILIERGEYLKNGMERKIRSVGDLKKFRHLTSQIPYTLALVEFALGYYVPFEELPLTTKNVLGRVHRLLVKIGMSTTDIFSYSKDLIEFRKNLNGIFILMLERGLNLPEALRAEGDKINNYFEEYLTLTKILRQKRPSQLDGRYLNALDDLVKGQLTWQLHCHLVQTKDQMSAGHGSGEGSILDFS